MIITDDFVLLASPKTGTSFTTAVLQTIHARRRLLGRFLPFGLQKRLFRHYKLIRPGYREHRVPRPRLSPGDKPRMSRHGCYRDIPVEGEGLPIVATVRNPFALYTSAYLFRMRSRKQIRHIADPAQLEQEYPGYPDISFEEYYDIIHRFLTGHYLQGIEPAIELGEQTINFIHFFFRDPAEVFRKIDHDYIESGAYRDDMADIRFMHQESLREDFKRLLVDTGYAAEECALVDSFKQQNVAIRARTERDIGQFYSPELTEKVLQRDALLFKMFPEYLPD